MPAIARGFGKHFSGAASEMAHLVLEMPGNTPREKQRKQRLELLAEHFPRLAGQERSESVPAVEIANRTAGGVTLTM
jgi:hypothetical protein